MKPKTALALLLLLHFLAHPAMHAPALSHSGAVSLSEPSEGSSPTAARDTLGSCLACRTGSSVLAPLLPVFLPALVSVTAPPAAKTDFLYARLTEFSLSSRAPPRS